MNETPNADYISQLKKLGELREQGALSEDEFQAEKQRLLGVSNSLPPGPPVGPMSEQSPTRRWKIPIAGRREERESTSDNATSAVSPVPSDSQLEVRPPSTHDAQLSQAHDALRPPIASLKGSEERVDSDPRQRRSRRGPVLVVAVVAVVIVVGAIGLSLLNRKTTDSPASSFVRLVEKATVVFESASNLDAEDPDDAAKRSALSEEFELVRKQMEQAIPNAEALDQIIADYVVPACSRFFAARGLYAERSLTTFWPISYASPAPDEEQRKDASLVALLFANSLFGIENQTEWSLRREVEKRDLYSTCRQNGLKALVESCTGSVTSSIAQSADEKGYGYENFQNCVSGSLKISGESSTGCSVIGTPDDDASSSVILTLHSGGVFADSDNCQQNKDLGGLARGMTVKFYGIVAGTFSKNSGLTPRTDDEILKSLPTAGYGWLAATLQTPVVMLVHHE